jgi:hypothetical protein
MRRRGVLMAEAAGMANALTLPLAATATLTWLLMAWLSPVALPNGFVGNIWLSAAAAGGGKLAGVKNRLPLAGAFTGPLACANLSAIADCRCW